MAAHSFVDLTAIDLNKVIADRDRIYSVLPHRFEFMQLDRIIHIDREQMLAVAARDVREDEFWVRGHIPGRPLFPGVLMMEAAAQFASYMTQELRPDPRFLGFGGIDGVKFRGAVTPPATLYFILKLVEVRSRRTIADAQGLLNNQLVFEARITGLPM